MSLVPERQYYCLNEMLNFTCAGPGGAIRWEVPPLFSREGFLNSDQPGINNSIDGVNATIYLAQVTPMFISFLTIQGVFDITVICSTLVPTAEKTLSLTTSSKQH